MKDGTAEGRGTECPRPNGLDGIRELDDQILAGRRKTVQASGGNGFRPLPMGEDLHPGIQSVERMYIGSGRNLDGLCGIVHTAHHKGLNLPWDDHGGYHRIIEEKAVVCLGILLDFSRLRKVHEGIFPVR